MIRIFKYMNSIQMQAAFWKEVAFILFFMAGTHVLFSFGGVKTTIPITYSVYIFIHHFAVNYEIYRFRRKRIDSNLSAEAAMEEYQTDICMINMENHTLHRIFTVILFLTAGCSIWLLVYDTALTMVISCVLCVLHFAAALYAFNFFKNSLTSIY